MAKKIDYTNLAVNKVVTTQPRIAPDPNMAPIDDDMKGVTIIKSNEASPAPKVTVTPAAVTAPIETPAPPVIEAVKQPVVPAATEGIPSVSPDGGQAVIPSANASTDDELEIKEDELPEGIRKRFSKLTSKRREAESKLKESEEKEKAKQVLLDAKDKELEFYKEVALSAPKTAAPVKTDAPAPVVTEKPEPVFADFENEADPITAFVNAKVNHIVSKRMAPVEHQLDPATQKVQRELAAVEVEHSDYRKVVTMDNPAIKILAENPIATLMIPASKNKLKLSYYLGKNIEDAKRIANMTDPIDIAVELRKIEDKFNTPTSSPQTVVPAAIIPANDPAIVVTKIVQKTNAPVPFKPINSTGSAPLAEVTSDTVKPDDLRDRPGYEFLKKRRY